MKCLAALAIAAGLSVTMGAHAEPARDNAAMVRGCIDAAAASQRLPPAILVILLNVEGGALGRVSTNTDGTVDIGPMQVNQIWIPELAAHWHASRAATFRALRDRFCANLEAGAWILRRGLDEAHGNFWDGVAIYHSHTTAYKTAYLRAVLKQTLRLQAEAARDGRPRPAAVAPRVVLAGRN